MAKTRVKNLERLRAKIAALPEIMKEEMAAANDKSADEIVALAKRNVGYGPPENGHIADTIRKEPGRHEVSRKVVVGDAEHPYAAPLEFGHANFGELNNTSTVGKRVPPNPFFFPAVRVVRKKHRSRAKRAVTKAIKRITGPAK